MELADGFEVVCYLILWQLYRCSISNLAVNSVYFCMTLKCPLCSHRDRFWLWTGLLPDSESSPGLDPSHKTTDPLNRTSSLSQTPILFFLPHKSIIETLQYVIQRTLRFARNHPIPTSCLAAVSPCTLLLAPNQTTATFLPPCMQLFQRQSTSFSASGSLCEVCQGSCWRDTKLLQSCESCSSRCCWQHPHAVKWSWQPARLPVFCQLRLSGLWIHSAATLLWYKRLCSLRLGWERGIMEYVVKEDFLVNHESCLASLWARTGHKHSLWGVYCRL